ncbi:MAG TPA: FdhF/YdeP family oxidoreductase, partial [Prolixibacteraceae bacterium]|nr:FdhF/YdeP family oxidoreductase [Prolixibacteraceae bacterium]
PEKAIALANAVELVAAHGQTLRRMVWDALIASENGDSPKKTGAKDFSRHGTFLPELSRIIAIQKQIRDVIISNELPDAHLPPLISLTEACGLTRFILKPDEIARYRERIAWLAGMESLGREIIRSVRALEKADLEKDAARLIGLNHDQPKTYAGGMDAVLSSLSFLYKETGLKKSRKLIGHFNQVAGFECPGCAWPNPDRNRSRFEFCENGAKNVSAEAMLRTIDASFFEKWSVSDLLLAPEHWLEQQGRLTEPMLLDENALHYRPVSWEDAFQIVARELRNLDHPDEAVFYASGRTSIEAAFLYQLFARSLGTNNLPNSANICHEPSGKAMTLSLGFGKSTVRLDDFPKASLIFLFGHNPGSNHPRMLSALQAAVRKGCKIVAVNPMPEASLMGFADPQEAASYLGKQTQLATLFLQPRINGDMALVRGIAKALLETEQSDGAILDRKFINEYTRGYEAYRKRVEETPWEKIISDSGIEKEDILKTTALYMQSPATILCWCLGITHHRNSIETLREMINLMLMKGNVGRPGAGLCPVRGHSNIQGIRTAGVGENMPLSFLEALEHHFPISVPRKPGLSVVPAIKAFAEGKARVLISLGGNLASAAPDTEFTEKALRNCRLTVQISTKLNRSHLVTGKRALILPALGRTDEDVRNGNKQYSTVEDATAKIGFSQGCLPPASPFMKNEVAIVTGLALATFSDGNGIDWSRLGSDNRNIREALAKTVDAFRDLDRV